MARTELVSPHGWFPDPEEPGRLRMWDGKAWTSLTKYPSAGDVVSGPTPSAPLPPRPAPRPAPQPSALAPHVAATVAATPPHAVERPPTDPSDATAATLVADNLYSAITLGLALVCIIVASSTGFAVIAVLPALVALRAYGVRETMAPIAALAATASVIIGLVLLAR